MKANDNQYSQYRSNLTRIWEPGKPCCYFIMLNPSTADDIFDDPTIRRCIGFAKREGCGSLIVANLFTRRATKPKDMINAPDPIGPLANDMLRAIRDHWCVGDKIIAGWGACPEGPIWFKNMHRERVEDVFDIIFDRKIYALGLTAQGQPRHPLYVRHDAPLIEFKIASKQPRK